MASVAGDILLRFNADTAGLDKGTRKIKSFERQTISSNQKVASSSRVASNAIRTLGAALAGLVSIQAGRSLLNTASSIRQVRIQIMSATTSVQQFNGIMGRLESLSLRTGSSLESTAGAFQTLQLSARTLGFDANEIVDVLDVFNDVAIATGASSFQLESALRQLGDAASTGTLRWQDFRIVLQNFPALAGAIASAMGLTLTELREAVASGQDMGEVFRAILNDQDRWEQAANEAPVTWERAINKVGAAWALLIGRIDEAFGIQDRLVAGLDEATKRINEWDVERSASKTIQALRPALEVLDNIGAALISVTILFLGFRKAINLIKGTKVFKDISKDFRFTKDFMGKSLIAVGGLGKAFVALSKGIWRAGKAIQIFNPLFLILTGLFKAFGADIVSVDVFVKALEVTLKSLGTALYAIGGIFDIVTSAIAEFFTELVGFATFGWYRLNNEDKKAGELLEKRTKTRNKLIVKSWEDTWNAIQDIWASSPLPKVDDKYDPRHLLSNKASDLTTDLRLPKPGENIQIPGIIRKEPDNKALEEWKQGIVEQGRLLAHELLHQFDIRKHWGEKTLELVKGFDILGINATSIKNSMELSALDEHHANLISRREDHRKEVENAARELAEAEAKIGKERSEEEIERLKRELEIKQEMREHNEEAIKETQQNIMGIQLRSGEAGLTALNNVLQGAGEKSKEFFMVRKVAALAQGALDAASAISAAYSWGNKIGGPVGGAAAAAVATTASALHLSAIADTNYKSFRAGGPAEAGGLYRVGEGGPEMFRAGGKQFMIPSESGQVIPNHNLSSGGGNTIINIKNYTSGRVSARESETSNGKEIDIIVKQVEGRLARGIRNGRSPMAKSMQSSYGLNRASGGF